MAIAFHSLFGRLFGIDQSNGDLVSNGRRLLANPAAKQVNATASTLTITADLHSGKLITLNRAAGIAVTLPAASGTGDCYEFYVGTTVTSNSTTIKVANSSDIMVGHVFQFADAGATMNGYETASTDDTITLDGSTKGGIKGDYFRLVDVAANNWMLEGRVTSTGTEASMLSATV